MKLTTLVLTTALALAPAVATSQQTRLTYPERGFSIEPFGEPGRVVSEDPFFMVLPGDGSFAPNVNVQVQPFAGTLEAYLEITAGQLAAAGLRWVGEPRLETDALVLEYTGTLEGRELRWLARAIRSAGRVYLVTATALAERWEDSSGPLTAAVESFRVERVSD